MRRNLLREAAMEDHAAAEAFVLCVSSHGGEDAIITSDNERITVDELTSYFDGKVCPSLIRKPKLFIIDACQGG